MFLHLLAQHAETNANLISRFLNPGTLAMLIPVAAVVMAGLTGTIACVTRHRERMRMIELGIHPDLPAVDEEQETAEVG